MRLSLISSALLLVGGGAIAGAPRVEPSDAAHADIGTQIVRFVSGVAGYARWPNSSDGHRLCVAGESAYLRNAPARLSRIGDRVWPVREIALDDTDATAGCDLLYLGALSVAQKTKLFAETGGRPILTISEDNPECADASMFCLAIRDGGVSLLANLDSISRSGIRIDPKVLQLARRKRALP